MQVRFPRDKEKKKPHAYTQVLGNQLQPLSSIFPSPFSPARDDDVDDDSALDDVDDCGRCQRHLLVVRFIYIISEGG